MKEKKHVSLCGRRDRSNRRPLWRESHRQWTPGNSEDRNRSAARALARRARRQAVHSGRSQRRSGASAIERARPTYHRRAFVLPRHLTSRRCKALVRSSASEDRGRREPAEAARRIRVRRYIVQSAACRHAGQGLADERLPSPSTLPRCRSTARIFTEVERRAEQSTQMEVLILRYGIFYGPGAWFDRDGDIARTSCATAGSRSCGSGQGVFLRDVETPPRPRALRARPALITSG